MIAERRQFHLFQTIDGILCLKSGSNVAAKCFDKSMGRE